jgi:hypothetical protein
MKQSQLTRARVSYYTPEKGGTNDLNPFSGLTAEQRYNRAVKIFADVLCAVNRDRGNVKHGTEIKQVS